MVNGDLESCETDLRNIRDQVQEAKDAVADVEEALAASKNDLDEKSSDINAFRKLEVSRRGMRQGADSQMDIKQKIEDNQRIQKDSKAKLTHWQARHKELKLIYVE